MIKNASLVTLLAFYILFNICQAQTLEIGKDIPKRVGEVLSESFRELRQKQEFSSLPKELKFTAFIYQGEPQLQMKMPYDPSKIKTEIKKVGIYKVINTKNLYLIAYKMRKIIEGGAYSAINSNEIEISNYLDSFGLWLTLTRNSNRIRSVSLSLPNSNSDTSFETIFAFHRGENIYVAGITSSGMMFFPESKVPLVTYVIDFFLKP